MTDKTRGMCCPDCGLPDTSDVTDSRPASFKNNGVIRRRRKCNACDAKWTTFEINAQVLETLPIFRRTTAHQVAALLRVICDDLDRPITERYNPTQDETET